MKRPALEHIIRAAADVTGETDFVIVGSSAVLAQYPDAPDAMLRSNEADMYPARAPEKAWDIDGSLGYGSQFHETFGYFADGVAPETALLPREWRTRAVALRNANTRNALGICPEIHDLAASKALAGRDKDREWIEAGAAAGLIDAATLRERIRQVEAPDALKEVALARVDGWFSG